MGPVVLEEIALDEHPAGILELEQILDCPGDTRERRIAHLPAQGFGDVVAANLDVGGREIPDDRVASPEQQILAGGFQVVVVDLERAGAGPPGDGLRIGADRLEVREVRVDDRRMPGVHRDPAPRACLGIAVQVATIEDQVAGDELRRRLARAEIDEVDERGPRLRPDLDPDEAIVMRPGRRDDHGAAAGLELGHDAGVRGVDADVRRRKARVGGARANGDPSIPVLPGKREGAHERRAGLERDHVSGPGSLEGGLEVVTRRDGENATGRGDRVRLHLDAGELRPAGQSLRVRFDEDEERRREAHDQTPSTSAHTTEVSRRDVRRSRCPRTIAEIRSTRPSQPSCRIASTRRCAAASARSRSAASICARYASRPSAR